MERATCRSTYRVTIRPALVLSFIAVLLSSTQCFAFAADLQNKIAGTNWSRIRGTNVIPSYASNTYEIWRNYNHEIFENELRLTAEVGYNSVRLWLNYAAFEELGTKMVDRVEDALELCAKYHLRAVIVLFDSCGMQARIFNHG